MKMLGFTICLLAALFLPMALPILIMLGLVGLLFKFFSWMVS